MSNTVIPPRIAPRNFTDGIITFIYGVLIAPILVAISCAAALVFLSLLNWTGICRISLNWLSILFFSLLGFLILGIVMPYFTVSSITITDEGIHFHRLFGFPKFMPWNRIKFVSLASRRELVANGWLFPPFPPRDMTMSFSSLKHYRIQWNTGFCYYPPLNPKDFEQCVKEYLQPEID